MARKLLSAFNEQTPQFVESLFGDTQKKVLKSIDIWKN
jgi:hypothetical protein